MALDAGWPAQRTFDTDWPPEAALDYRKQLLQVQDHMRGAAMDLVLQKETYLALKRAYRSTEPCTVRLVWFLVLKHESNLKLHGPLDDRLI